ncbi:MAG: hypothetical protein IKM33_01965 [Clostridia bacterium]|nr:hypothetical protein [Clostridia bacterium]
MFRKIVVLFIAALLLFNLMGCMYIPVKKSIKLSKDESVIQSIDIYCVEDAYYEGDVSGLRSEISPVCTLTAEQQDDFVKELLSLKFETEIYLLPMPMDGGYDYEGYVVSVVYDDGSYDLIAEEGQYSYLNVGNGSHKYDYADYCGTKDWSAWIETHIGNLEPANVPPTT